MMDIIRLCLRVEKARDFFEDKNIPDIEKERYRQNLYDLLDSIDEKAYYMTDSQIDKLIELLGIVFTGGRL